MIKKILIIFISILIILFIIEVELYVYTPHTIYIEIYTEKHVYNWDENVTFYLKPSSTLFNFNISGNCPIEGVGIGIFRIPSSISPIEILSNSTLLDKIMYISDNFGIVPFKYFTNNMGTLKLTWNRTVIHILDPMHPQLTYSMAPSGYYIIAPDVITYGSSYNNIVFKVSNYSLFYLKGINLDLKYTPPSTFKYIINNTANLDLPSKLSVKYFIYGINETKWFNASVYIFQSQITLIDNQSLNLTKNLPIQVLINLNTPIGNYIWIKEFGD